MGVNASLNIPSGLCVDNANNIYVADRANHIIRKITPNGNVSTIAGTGSQGFGNGDATTATFRFPSGIAVDDLGVLYISDTNNGRVRAIDNNNQVTTLTGGVSQPFGLLVENSNALIVAESGGNIISRVRLDGTKSLIAGSGNVGNDDGNGFLASFFAPSDVALDASGNIYVADTNNNIIRMIQPNGDVVTIAGDGTPG